MKKPAVVVKVPKVQKVIVPKKKIVYVPTQKKVIVKRPATSTVRVSNPTAYATGSYTVPQVQQVKMPVPLAPPQPTIATIPQRTIIQKPIPVPVKVPAQVRPMPMPMQVKTIPYSNRTLATTSYRPSLQLQPTQAVSPYKQVTYRPNLKTTKVARYVPMRKVAPMRTVSPVTTMPNVQSYRPAQQLILPTPVAQPQIVSRPPVPIVSKAPIPQPPMPTVRQIQTIPAQTAVVSQIVPPKPQVPVQKAPVVSQVPVQKAPVVSQMPVIRQVPVVSQAPVQTMSVARPPVAVVTPMSVAPNLVRPPVQNVQPLATQMVKPVAQNLTLNRPSVYSASTYRPTMRRNYGGFTGYRQITPMVNTNMISPTGYTTRTYRPRKL